MTMATSAFMGDSALWGFSFTNDPCGHSRGNRACGEIFCNDRSGTDDASIANGHASSDHDLGTEPDVVSDADVALVLRLLPEWLAGFELVVGCSDEDFRGEG